MTCVSKEYEIKTKIEQEQCPQLKMLFLLGYNLKIIVYWGEYKNLIGEIFPAGAEWANFQLVEGAGRTPLSHPVWKILWCAIFWFTWFTIVVFMIAQKPHGLRKPFSSFRRKWNQIARFLSFNVTKTTWGIKFLFWM